MKIAVLDANGISRIGLGMLLQSEPEVESVEMFERLEDFDCEADVVVMDTMPGVNVSDAVQSIRKIRPDTAIVLMTDNDSAETLRDFLGDKSRGKAFIKRSESGEITNFMDCLKSVISGRTVLDPSVVYRLTNAPPPINSPINELTNREMEVLCLIASGFTNAAIAAMLYIQPRTVEHHINRIFSKLGLRLGGTTHLRVRAAIMYHQSIEDL